MSFLPIVARELRVAARRRGTYWLRSAAALAVIIAGAWLFLVMQSGPSRDLGKGLLTVLTGSAGLFALFSGLRSTADCLSEEKREGTLGLLFLTDLKGYDVVLGKLAANSLNACYALLAAVPMLGIPLLIGGITAGEVARLALVILNTLFFSLAVGILVSTLSRSAQRASALTLVLLLLPTAAAPALGAMWIAHTRAPSVPELFLLPSPAYSFSLAFAGFYRTRPDQFLYSMLVVHGMGWLCLLAASLIAPHCWQERSAKTFGARWREWWQQWAYGEMAQRLAFRKRLLDTNAFLWLAARIRLRPLSIWAVLALFGCGWLWGLAKFRRDWLNEGVYLTTGLLLNFFIKSAFAAEAARTLAEERRAGTLELLLSTPLSVREILAGQALALQRQFLGPVLAVLCIECVFVRAGLPDLVIDDERGLWVSVWVAGMLMLVTDLAALYWVAMWQGLTAKNAARAASQSLARIGLCPWAGIALVILIGAVSQMNGSPPPDVSWHFFLALWFILGLAADFGFAAYARQKLLTEFRLAAQQRYSPGFWERLLQRTAPDSGQAPQIPLTANRRAALSRDIPPNSAT